MDWFKEQLGLVEVKHYIPGDEYRGGKFDLYIWVDHGEDVLPVPKYKCPKPNCYWASDTHLGLDYRLNKAKEFDVVFVTISSHVDLFRKFLKHDRVYWLPHAGEPTAYYPYNIVKKYDVGFIGYLPTQERIDLLDSLFRRFPNFKYGQAFFEEAARQLSMCKIGFNCSVRDEANMRAFEIPLTKTLLLTDYSPDLEKLGFKDGENVAFYDNPEEMLEKATFYVEHDEERELVAECGYNLVLNNHTYLHRAYDMLEKVIECLDLKW